MTGKFVLIISIILALSPISKAQSYVVGHIMDEQSEPVAYANVRVLNTSDGTISNEYGDFRLEIDRKQSIEVGLLGYENVERSVAPGDSVVIVLKEKAYDLGEISITADREDPAYAIIRKAIKKRPFYRKSINQYSAGLYIKGLVKLTDAPEKILGNEVGDMGGLLDTTGQGIIYLSESISDFYFKQPDQVKEVIVSSKVAESDDGFSFNSIQSAYFNIYDQFFPFNKTVVIPLADNALTFYKYRLEGVSVEADGRQLNKISIIPKSTARPLFTGTIYIYDETYSVDKVDLNLRGKAVGIPIFDNMKIVQEYISVDNKEVLFSQTSSFIGGFFGFKFSGVFNFLFSDYVLEDPTVDDINFREAFRAEAEANETPRNYWEEIRPIPLSDAEVTEYSRKDSLRKVWKSKSFLDSMDRVNNKVKLIDVLTGYSYDNSYKNRSLSYGGLLSAVRFNPVEGLSIGTRVGFSQYDTLGNRDYEIGGNLRYGFSDQRLKWAGSFRKELSPVKRSFFEVKVGDLYNQLCNCGDYPVPVLYNTLSALVEGNNDIKYYRHQGAEVSYGTELFNGLYFNASAEYARRSRLMNNVDNQPWLDEKPYMSNLVPLSFKEGDVFRTSFSLRYRFNQRYMMIGGRKSILSSDGPALEFKFRNGLKIFNADSEFKHIELKIEDKYVSFNVLGSSHYIVALGSVFDQRNMNTLDSRFFISNQFRVVPSEWYDHGFKRLPHYTYYAQDQYFMAYYEHDFDGLLLNTIPVINKLGFETHVSGSYLRSNGRTYSELGIGIDDIGWGIFRFIRLDYVWSFSEGNLSKKGILIGVKIN